MTDLTLPGDIPGLLRRGSPIEVTDGLHKGKRGTIHRIQNGFAVGAYDGLDQACIGPTGSLALDLTDKTGRAHAAWWAQDRLGSVGVGYSVEDSDAKVAAMVGHDMTDAQIALLRDLVLRLAGRSQ